MPKTSHSQDLYLLPGDIVLENGSEAMRLAIATENGFAPMLAVRTNDSEEIWTSSLDHVKGIVQMGTSTNLDELDRQLRQWLDQQRPVGVPIEGEVVSWSLDC
jgi:hypothetical protein